MTVADVLPVAATLLAFGVGNAIVKVLVASFNQRFMLKRAKKMQDALMERAKQGGLIAEEEEGIAPTAEGRGPYI